MEEVIILIYTNCLDLSDCETPTLSSSDDSDSLEEATSPKILKALQGNSFFGISFISDNKFRFSIQKS